MLGVRCRSSSSGPRDTTMLWSCSSLCWLCCGRAESRFSGSSALFAGGESQVLAGSRCFLPLPVRLAADCAGGVILAVVCAVFSVPYWADVTTNAQFTRDFWEVGAITIVSWDDCSPDTGSVSGEVRHHGADCAVALGWLLGVVRWWTEEKRAMAVIVWSTGKRCRQSSIPARTGACATAAVPDSRVVAVGGAGTALLSGADGLDNPWRVEWEHAVSMAGVRSGGCGFSGRVNSRSYSASSPVSSSAVSRRSWISAIRASARIFSPSCCETASTLSIV